MLTNKLLFIKLSNILVRPKYDKPMILVNLVNKITYYYFKLFKIKS